MRHELRVVGVYRVPSSGFVFGVGCALAVMYSIYSGGYRAAVADSMRVEKPERLVRALAQLRGRGGVDAKTD